MRSDVARSSSDEEASKERSERETTAGMGLKVSHIARQLHIPPHGIVCLRIGARADVLCCGVDLNSVGVGADASGVVLCTSA